MRALSLFSGIGGFDLAMKRKGIEIIGACEIDKFARQIYEKNFPGIKIYENATKLNAKDLPDFDILAAGFPCQPFSKAGLGKGFDDIRGTLVFEILRITREKRPSILLLENVKGLLSNQNGSTFIRILQEFEKLGYLLQWQTINSSAFTAQNRERIFIIGYSRESRRQKILPIREPNETNEGVRRCKQIGYLENETYESAGRVYSSEGLARTIKSTFDRTGKYGIIITHGKIYNLARNLANTLTTKYRNDWKRDRTLIAEPVNVQTSGRKGHIEKRIKSGFGQIGTHFGGSHKHQDNLVCEAVQLTGTWKQHGRKFKKTGEPSFCVLTNDVNGIFDGMRIRRLTPVECERLQGFPDNFTKGISDNQRYKCLGNAVTVPVIEYILDCILED